MFWFSECPGLAPLRGGPFLLGGNNTYTNLRSCSKIKHMTHEYCCARCASAGKTCCQQTEIYVTVKDLKRMGAYTSRLDFFEFRPPADPAYFASKDDPPWQQHVFRLDGTRRVLKQQPNGDCIFLTGRGCSLTLEVRPLICRLYPFTYTVTGVQTETDERCPVNSFCQGKSVLEIFGISMQTVSGWHADLYLEMMHPEGDGTDENWTDLRPAV